jgi:hypothetical protein
VDLDGDGYGSPASASCAYIDLDCNDTDPNVNPGMREIIDNGINDDCNPNTPDEPPVCAAFPVNPGQPPALSPFFALFLAPAAFIFVVRRCVTRK